MESNQYEILSFFKGDNLQKRLAKELSELKAAKAKIETSLIVNRLHVKMHLPSNIYSFKLMNYEIVFEFSIGRGYPITAPRLYLMTALFQPFINDCRDLLPEVYSEPWTYKSSLVAVYNKLDDFLKRLSHEAQNPIVVQKLGRYYLGDRFTFIELMHFKPLYLFQAFKLETDRIALHYIGVSETHLFIWIPDVQPNVLSGKLSVPRENYIYYLYLHQYAEMQSLYELRINKEESEIVMLLKTHRQKKLNLYPLNIRLTYRIVNCKNFYKKILKCLPKFQPTTIDYETGKKDSFTPIMTSIKAAYSNLQRYLNKDSITELNRCYQSAVEYLSSINDPIYHVYLNKIALLFLREDVKLVSNIKSEYTIK